MTFDDHIVFNVGRTFQSDHFAGRNARVTLLKPKRLTLGVAVANLAEKQNIKMAFPQCAELWKLIDLHVRKDFRQAKLALIKQFSGPFNMIHQFGIADLPFQGQVDFVWQEQIVKHIL